MSILNHSIPSKGQPLFSPNGSGTQDACQHLSLKPLQLNSAKKASLIIASCDTLKRENGSLEASIDGNSRLSHLLTGNIEFEPLSLHFVCPPLEKQNIALLNVEVSSAAKLDDTQIDLIARKMQKLTGFRNLSLENNVDPSLIAGFVISYGDSDSQVIDLSVKGQLAALAARVESSDRRSVGNNEQSWNFSNNTE